MYYSPGFYAGASRISAYSSSTLREEWQQAAITLSTLGEMDCRSRCIRAFPSGGTSDSGFFHAAQFEDCGRHSLPGEKPQFDAPSSRRQRSRKILTGDDVDRRIIHGGHR